MKMKIVYKRPDTLRAPDHLRGFVKFLTKSIKTQDDLEMRIDSLGVEYAMKNNLKYERNGDEVSLIHYWCFI